MLAGSAYTELDRLDDANRVFGRVRAMGDKSDRRKAESWIAFIDEKRQLRNASIRLN